MTNPLASDIPKIAPVADGIRRPLWSVMIPNYNSGEYLRKTLQSVLAQDCGPERMEIEVVDHCSTEGDPEALVRSVGGGRVAFYRRPVNEGPVANFNACIQRSHGRLIHILHSDDFVLPGFYSEIERLADQHHDTGLLAARCFLVDESEIIVGLTEHIRDLEHGGHSIESLYYNQTAMLFPGVVIRRAFYEVHGGFMPGMGHTADREMWARAVSLGGGCVSTNILACFRVSATTDTASLTRSGENLRSQIRLNELFSARYPGFSAAYAQHLIASMALSQTKNFARRNDAESAEKNRRVWLENCSWSDRVKEALRPLIRRILGKSNP
jgi:glycosyltransferase involved in cell wall biosynthesis